MKDLCSYLAPFTSILIIGGCDYAFFILNLRNSNYYKIEYAIFALYNWLCIMAFWSLIMTFFCDPGFIPLKYSYN